MSFITDKLDQVKEIGGSILDYPSHVVEDFVGNVFHSIGVHLGNVIFDFGYAVALLICLYGFAMIIINIDGGKKWAGMGFLAGLFMAIIRLELGI